LAAFRLTLLGGFTLATADGRPLSLPTRKDRLLLAYLALSPGRPQPRERLAGLLWGDRAEAQARDSLKQSLASLRQAFRQAGADPVRADRDSVALDPDAIETDAVVFARLATAAKSPDRATVLYQGELLEGIDSAGAEFDTWLRVERERLADLAVRALEQLAQCAASQTAVDEATRLGRHLLARDPLRESVYRSLMRLATRQGDRAEALKLYAACRGALQRDLGVAPDIRTEELYRDILTDRVAPSSAASQAPTSVDRPSIAVLPFSNLSGDTSLGHLCDGITEDIITGLGRFHILFVIDRHSCFAVAQQTADLAEIGRRLGATYLVQGSLQRLGERLRTTVRLVDAARRAQLWGDAYDIPISEFLALSDKVTGALVTTLHDRVESSLLEQSRRKPALAAYECLLRGIKHLRGYAPDDNRRALALFQQARELDPDYALARAYHALAQVIIHDYDAPDAVMAEALALASTAVDLDAGDSRCQWVLASLHRTNGDFKDAERHYRRALELNPNDANAMAGFGRTLAAEERWDEGLDLVREAMRLNPYHPEWYWQVLGGVLYSAGRYADAAEAFGRTTRRGFWARCYLAACFAQMGRLEEAAAEIAEARRLRPDCSLDKMRTRDFSPIDCERFVAGLRKAGMPE
jgi:DNA-binding SARP family transcriptional activator/Flp pilus assembly protein TadD